MILDMMAMLRVISKQKPKHGMRLLKKGVNGYPVETPCMFKIPENSSEQTNTVKEPGRSRSHSVSFKMETVAFHKAGNSKEATARKFKVDPKRIREWVNNEDKFRAMISDSTPNKQYKRLQGGGRKGNKSLMKETGTMNRKFCSYNMGFKLETVAYHKAGHNKEETARKFNVDPRRIREWVKQEDKLREFLAASLTDQGKKLKGGGRKPMSHEIHGSVTDTTETDTGNTTPCHVIQEGVHSVNTWKTDGNVLYQCNVMDIKTLNPSSCEQSHEHVEAPDTEDHADAVLDDTSYEAQCSQTLPDIPRLTTDHIAFRPVEDNKYDIMIKTETDIENVQYVDDGSYSHDQCSDQKPCITACHVKQEIVDDSCGQSFHSDGPISMISIKDLTHAVPPNECCHRQSGEHSHSVSDMTVRKVHMKQYDISFKLEAVDFYKAGNSKEATARKFKVDPKRIRVWVKQEDKLRAILTPTKQRKRLEGAGRKRHEKKLKQKKPVNMPRKNCSYTVDFKLKAVDFHREGRSKEETARQFNVDPKQIREWVKQKDKLCALMSGDVRDKYRKKLKGGGRKACRSGSTEVDSDTPRSKTHQTVMRVICGRTEYRLVTSRSSSIVMDIESGGS